MHVRIASGGYTQFESWLLFTPRRTGNFPLIVGLHGAGGLEMYGQLPEGFPLIHSLFKAIVEAGYIIMCPDYKDGISSDGSHTWGNDGSTTTIDNAITYAQSTLGAAPGKAALFPTSMGNLAAWNYYRRFPSKVAGIASVAGATDLVYHHSGNDEATGKYENEINTAYGGSSGYDAAVATHDPMQFAPGLAALPYLHYHAEDDIVAPYANAANFVPLVDGTLVSIPTGGHSEAPWGEINRADLIAFFRALDF